MIPQTIDVTQALSDLDQAAANLQGALDRLQTSNRISDQLALGSAYKALKRCRGAEGLSPSARKEVTSALRMTAAALGIDDCG